MRKLIKNATIINEDKSEKGSVLLNGELIEKIFSGEIPPNYDFSSTETIDASGLYLIPGVIDDQVHYREPGLTHKGDIASESFAAIAGGITSYMEMPNTNPQTITQELLESKYRRAAEVSFANFSFYMGATNNNIKEILKTDPSHVCGIKVFMGASTGNMLVDNENTLSEIFRNSPTVIATHCEDEPTIRINSEKAKNKYGEHIPISAHSRIRNDEACYLSSSKAVNLATRYGARLHVLHLSSAREMSLFDSGHVKNKKITAEVCVHHLWFDDRDYITKGTLIKWNPAIKTVRDKEALWEALLSDKIDVIATDHAPHTLDEKNNTYFKAPSGGPLVQHSLIAMLEMSRKGMIPIEKVIRKMCHAPADLFRIDRRGYIREGYFADMVLINPSKPWTVSKENILYKCGWSPFEGVQFSHSVTHTFVNGKNLLKEKIPPKYINSKRLKFLA